MRLLLSSPSYGLSFECPLNIRCLARLRGLLSRTAYFGFQTGAKRLPEAVQGVLRYHDVETAAWFTDLPINKEGVASFTKGLAKNQDGSVDIYFGPKAPKGKETNWLPTVPDKKFFLIFRFYRPKPSLFNKSWKLNDIEKLK
jgi:hypothetical protein